MMLKVGKSYQLAQRRLLKPQGEEASYKFSLSLTGKVYYIK